MKKIVLSLALVAMMSVSFVSCKDAAAPEATVETEATEETVEQATEAIDSTAVEATEAVEATPAATPAATEEVKK